jgi:hypothetical protein
MRAAKVKSRQDGPAAREPPHCCTVRTQGPKTPPLTRRPACCAAAACSDPKTPPLTRRPACCAAAACGDSATRDGTQSAPARRRQHTQHKQADSMKSAHHSEGLTHLRQNRPSRAMRTAVSTHSDASGQRWAVPHTAARKHTHPPPLVYKHAADAPDKHGSTAPHTDTRRVHLS